MIPLASFLSPALPTEQDIHDLLDVHQGVGRMSVYCELLNNDFTPLPLQHPPPGSEAPNDVSFYVDVASVDWNASGDVHHKAAVIFKEFPTMLGALGVGQINPLKNLIRVSVRFWDIPGTQLLLQVPLGIFCFFIPARKLRDAGNELAIDGYDLMMRLSRLFFQNPWLTPVGSNVVEWITGGLQCDMLPPDRGGRQPSGAGVITPVSQPGGRPVVTTVFLPFDSTTSRVGSYTYWSPGPSSAFLPGPGTIYGSAAVNGIAGGQASYDNDSTVPGGYLRALYTGPIGSTGVTVLRGVPSATVPTPYLPGGSGWAGIYPPGFGTNETPQVGTLVQPDLAVSLTGGTYTPPPTSTINGSGTGYCGSGFAVADPRSGLTPWNPPGATFVPGTYYVRVAGGGWTYDSRIGYKVDDASGNIIDPFSCQPMTIAVIPWTAARSQIYSRLAANGHQIALNMGDGTSRDAVTGVETDPVSGLPASSTTFVFQSLGGDGGVGTNSTIPQLVTGGSWFPDGNAPGLTPSGCEFFGPNIQASRIRIPASNITSWADDPAKRGVLCLKYWNAELASMGYYPLDMDEAANVVSGPIPWQYTDDAGNSYIPSGGEYTFETGRTRFQGEIDVKILSQELLNNYYQTAVENNGQPPILADALNTNPQSLVSVENLGYILPTFNQNDKIPDLATAQEAAFVGINEGAISQQSVELTIPLFPVLRGNDLILINKYGPTGLLEIDCLSGKNPFIVTGFTHDLKGWMTKITASRPVLV